MKCSMRKKNDINNRNKSGAVWQFVQYTIEKRSPWLWLVFGLIFVNTVIGICNVFAPKWILACIVTCNGNVSLIFRVIFEVEILILILQIAKIWLKNQIAVIHDKLFRCAYSDIGLAQSQMKFHQMVSKKNQEMLEEAKYGIWEIPTMSEKIEKLGVALTLFVINCSIVISFNWRYFFYILGSCLIAIPIYKKIAEIEIDNSKRLWPENRAFGWYCKLITNLQYGEDIRVNQSKPFIIDNCCKLMDRIYSINQIAFSKKGAYLGIAKFIFQFQIVTIAVLLGNLFIAGEIPIENFALLFGAVSAISASSNTLITGISQIKKIAAIIIPFFEIYHNDCGEVTEYDNLSVPKVCKVEFDHVSFAYPGCSKKVLNDISFSIESGTRIAIVGPNGAGKSTIAKLLCRLYEPQEGKILVNGIDILALGEKEYREYISSLFQDFQLLPFRIQENVLCKYEADISSEEQLQLREVFKATGLEYWIDLLGQKDLTFISPLFSSDYVIPSGGQTQLIAIARAIIRNGSIYLFDEPTRALDGNGEDAVLKMLSLLRNEICVMISHRLSHVKSMDKIIVLNEGKIVEYGSHEQLMKQDGLYKTMYEKQAAKYGIDVNM